MNVSYPYKTCSLRRRLSNGHSIFFTLPYSFILWFFRFLCIMNSYYFTKKFTIIHIEYSMFTIFCIFKLNMCKPSCLICYHNCKLICIFFRNDLNIPVTGSIGISIDFISPNGIKAALNASSSTSGAKLPKSYWWMIKKLFYQHKQYSFPCLN